MATWLEYTEGLRRRLFFRALAFSIDVYRLWRFNSNEQRALVGVFCRLLLDNETAGNPTPSVAANNLVIADIDTSPATDRAHRESAAQRRASDAASTRYEVCRHCHNFKGLRTVPRFLKLRYCARTFSDYQKQDQFQWQHNLFWLFAFFPCYSR